MKEDSMKKLIMTVMFGWCVLTKVDTYTLDDESVEWKDLTEGTTVTMQIGDAKRKKSTELLRTWYATTEDFLENRSTTRKEYGFITYPLTTPPKQEYSRRITETETEEKCDAMTLSDFEKAK